MINSAADTPLRVLMVSLIFSKTAFMFVLLGLISNLPSYFRTLKPRKSKPSSMCVICVFSSERVKPLMAKKFLSAGLTVSSRNSFELLVITHLTHGFVSKPYFLTPASRSDSRE